jgi:hypothetical protein
MHRSIVLLSVSAAAVLAACGAPADNSNVPTAPPSSPPPVVTTPPTAPPPAQWPVVVHSGIIDASTGVVWAPRTIHRISGNLLVANGQLTIEAPAIVEVDGPHEFKVRGVLIARGTADAPIEFRPRSSGATWAGVTAEARTIASPNQSTTGVVDLDFRHVTLRGCGAPAVDIVPLPLAACLRLSVNGYHVETVTVDGSVGVGVYVSGEATSTSRGLLVRGSAREPLVVSGSWVGLLPSDLNLSDNLAQPWVTVSATGGVRGRFEGGVTVARIRDAGVPYRMTTLGVTGQGTNAEDRLVRAQRLVVDPGVQMRFGQRGTFSVGDLGSGGAQLQLLGTPQRPIILAAQDPSARWCGVRLNAAARGTTHSFAHVVIDGASAGTERDPATGAACPFDGAIHTAGLPVTEYQFDVATSSGIVTRLDVRDVRIRNWTSAALSLGFGTLFTDTSRVLRVEQGGGVAIATTEPNLLPTLPDSLFITGGLEGVVRLDLFPPTGQCPRHATVSGRWRPADYVIRNGHYVQTQGHVDIRANRITLDPGRALIFGGFNGQSCALALGTNATATIQGTLQSRLIIQSSSQTAAVGGVVFAGPTDTNRDRMDYVDVTRAAFTFEGRTSAIRVRGEGRGGFITNVRVVDGVACGIARERGSGPVFTTDFLAPNLTNQVSGHTPTQCSF